MHIYIHILYQYGYTYIICPYIYICVFHVYIYIPVCVWGTCVCMGYLCVYDGVPACT